MYIGIICAFQVDKELILVFRLLDICIFIYIKDDIYILCNIPLIYSFYMNEQDQSFHYFREINVLHFRTFLYNLVSSVSQYCYTAYMKCFTFCFCFLLRHFQPNNETSVTLFPSIRLLNCLIQCIPPVCGTYSVHDSYF